MKYWINTISKDHVLLGVKGGFTQAGHGKNIALKRLSKNDWIIFYSPKISYVDVATLQKFTAIGQINDYESYQVAMSSDFKPWRRSMIFTPSKEVEIRPILGDLSFIKDPSHWGYIFRFGLFEIPEQDFTFIHKLMID